VQNSSTQAVFRRLINTVVSRDSEELSARLRQLLKERLEPQQLKEAVVNILANVIEKLRVSKSELEKEAEAAKSKNDTEVFALLQEEELAVARMLRQTVMAERLAGALEAHVLANMTEKIKPLLAGILEGDGGEQGALTVLELGKVSLIEGLGGKQSVSGMTPEVGETTGQQDFPIVEEKTEVETSTEEKNISQISE
ncbi:uncharacterized protein LOC108675404, partial [Hyalella azteca]|uniref:Uncharacterized protein LOC108675404 n=1 Tax=Hyalella azteca TaxID=294128 RepID=A0A8B7P1E9_HYAAZ